MLYRIVQEQLNNIVKHANARSVTIRLSFKSQHLHLTIVDDGVGFNTDHLRMGIGLQNIQNRVEFYAGNLNIISAEGKGCRMEITVPVLEQV